MGTEVTEQDRGYLWLVMVSGEGRWDPYRARKPKHADWFKRAVENGWLNDEGWITPTGRRLAAEYVDD